MTHREKESTRHDRGAFIKADSIESRNLQLTPVSPGPEVIFADGWDVAAPIGAFGGGATHPRRHNRIEEPVR